VSRRFWSERAAALTPYVPGEQPRGETLLKLNTNESAWPPSPRVLEAVRGIGDDEILRYPDPTSRRLREAAAVAYGVDADQVFAGNGSDEVLAHCFAAFLEGRPLAFPDITYSFYPVWSQLYGVRSTFVPLREDFSVAVADYATCKGAILLANPNAPTGMALRRADLESLLEGNPERLLIVDEAYVDFGADSAVPLVQRYDNLLVVQTLSKSRALAGLRVGLAFAQASLIDALVRVRDSFNSYPIDCVAERAAAAALEDREWFDTCRQRTIATRERLARALEERNFRVLPSRANFLFTRHDRLAGAALFDALRERGVLVRRWDKPRIEDYLRISIGTDTQAEQLLAALDAALESLA
jgi:histidinol-phosphate aminotransferase